MHVDIGSRQAFTSVWDLEEIASSSLSFERVSDQAWCPRDMNLLRVGSSRTDWFEDMTGPVNRVLALDRLRTCSPMATPIRWVGFSAVLKIPYGRFW